MDQKEAIGALIGTATIVGFGYCACKYLDKMSDVKAVEHFNVLRKPSQTKKSASAASAKPKRSAPKKPALKNKKKDFPLMKNILWNSLQDLHVSESILVNLSITAIYAPCLTLNLPPKTVSLSEDQETRKI